jgi:hypothetical protein
MSTKPMVLARVGGAALACAPMAQAKAALPLLAFLGHLIIAHHAVVDAARIARAPVIAASTAAFIAQQSLAPYPYYGGYANPPPYEGPAGPYAAAPLYYGRAPFSYAPVLPYYASAPAYHPAAGGYYPRTGGYYRAPPYALGRAAARYASRYAGLRGSVGGSSWGAPRYSRRAPMYSAPARRYSSGAGGYYRSSYGFAYRR